MALRAVVMVRDSNRQRRGVLPVLRGEAILRVNDVGSWWFELDATEMVAGRCVPGGGVVVIDRDTQLPFFSGPFTKLERDAADDGPQRTLRVEGVTDDVHLFDRLTLPDPTRADVEQSLSSESHYTATGAAETVARFLVASQVAQSAIPVRRVAGLTTESDQGRGNVVSISARYNPTVGKVLQELAVVGGINWRVVQVGTDLVFQVSEPRDLSRRARFSRRLGNMGEFSASDQAPTVTDVTLLAQGELTARTVRHRAATDPDALVWGRRIEQAKDRRDTDDDATLDQAGDEELADGGPVSSVSFNALDLPRMTYTRDYGFDYVTAETDWGTVTDLVRQVTLTWEPWGVRVKPLIGPAAARDPNEPVSVRLIKDLQKRLGRLEGVQ